MKNLLSLVVAFSFCLIGSTIKAAPPEIKNEVKTELVQTLACDHVTVIAFDVQAVFEFQECQTMESNRIAFADIPEAAAYVVEKPEKNLRSARIRHRTLTDEPPNILRDHTPNPLN
ncbi:hypothetical protein [Flavobacterium sp.]|uniref:hypothetical protein n=1 Tax=Flavobacterium sp. TaxID=239 RepID=UPI0011FB359F|nr:hypothetical protein [Flavobacterium sp.]RZJ71070.1 MAG: hypothetical protein EOO49_11495 [Flavobacterium sp.]